MGGRAYESADEALVVAAILGDLDAFDELAGRYRAAAVRIAQAIVGREHAEDVAQDALLLAFKALPSIEDPTRFPQWLGAIARNRALRVARQEGARRATSVALDEVLVERMAAISRPLAGERETEELVRAVDELPPDYALAMRLRYFDEMPLKRIAATIDAPLSTVKWRLHRGRALLRERTEQLLATAANGTTTNENS